MLLHCGSGYIALSTIVDYFQKTNHEMIPSRPNLPSVLVAIVSDRCSIRRLSTLTQRQVYQPQKRFIEVIACTEAAEEAKVLDSQPPRAHNCDEIALVLLRRARNGAITSAVCLELLTSSCEPGFFAFIITTTIIIIIGFEKEVVHLQHGAQELALSNNLEALFVEKTAAVKKTPRQAASSIESSGRLSFDIPVDTGMYQ